ncbi:MAG TPA: hypothetical protein VFD98_05315 [Terracidiphilus sp.]|nr:hypothetical protein [Terracidiphilus sp.]
MTRTRKLAKRLRREREGSSQNTNPARTTAAPPVGRLDDGLKDADCVEETV